MFALVDISDTAPLRKYIWVLVTNVPKTGARRSMLSKSTSDRRITTFPPRDSFRLTVEVVKWYWVNKGTDGVATRVK
jgi:hypothetical protein